MTDPYEGYGYGKLSIDYYEVKLTKKEKAAIKAKQKIGFYTPK